MTQPDTIGEGWQDIASAPKDEREICNTPMPRHFYVLLAFAPDDVSQWSAGMCVGYWDSYYAPGGAGYYEGCSPWVIADCGETTNLHYGLPSHWQPLPNPPESSQAE